MAHNIDHNRYSAKILGITSTGESVCASSARISTTQGTALEIFEKTLSSKGNKELILKVLSSGHSSLIEHLVFNIAFNSVSVFVEQFIIEHRLASYTVQSRRYVNVKNVGYYVPNELSDEKKIKYCAHMEELFSGYETLMKFGIPKEDARFVLPYCFKSNFYCTCNARELLYITENMIFGRGKDYTEIYSLGLQLKEQLEVYLPGIWERKKNKTNQKVKKSNPIISDERVGNINVNILCKPTPPMETLQSINSDVIIHELLQNSRQRELEFINYGFKIDKITLASLTHLTRHRIQSLLIPPLEEAIILNNYIMPETIENNPSAKKLYTELVSKNTFAARNIVTDNEHNLAYFCLSGSMLQVSLSMNVRELRHFISLRTCERAQWEIKEIADKMLILLREDCSEIFKYFGPSCFPSGACPEGKMSCGKYVEINKKYGRTSLIAQIGTTL